MDVFIARQPIFDRENNILGYELLFRDSNENFSRSNGDEATINVIRNSFINIGISKVTSGKRAFINFTANTLKTDVFTIMSPDNVIIEILEEIL